MSISLEVNMDRIHALATMIVLCLPVVVAAGIFWHLWHSWGNLILGEFVLVGFIAFLFRNAVK